MSGRTFLDTNVVVYAFDDDEPARRDRARELLAGDSRNLVVSTQVLSEFYVVTTRKLATPVPEADAAAAVERLARLAVVHADADLVRDGIALARGAKLSLWDGLIVAAARAGGCDRLLTEDLTHGSTVGSVRIEDPFRSAG